jgi:ketosteroid isomerase-like protein
MIDSAPMSRAWVLGLVLVALIAGCGGGGGDDQQSARDAAQQYVDAYNAGDFDRLCDLLSESYKQQLKVGSSCPAYFREQTSGAATSLTLVDVQEKGDMATAHLHFKSADPAGRQGNESVELVRQDGSWRVATVTGYYARN